MGNTNIVVVSANELLLLMASIIILGIIGGFIGEKLRIPDVVI